MVWKALPRPRVICSLCEAPVGLAAVQMLPLGEIAASRRVPKLGPRETSRSADSFPPPWEVAMAISSPSGPFSEATVECIQTKVTRLDLLTSRRSPAAVEENVGSGTEAMVWTPPAQRVAPRGSVH